MLNRGPEGSQAVVVPHPLTQALPESAKPTPGCGRAYSTTRGRRPASSLPRHHGWRRRWPYTGPRLRDRRRRRHRGAQVRTGTRSAGSPTRGPKAAPASSLPRHMSAPWGAPRGGVGGPTQRCSSTSASCRRGGVFPDLGTGGMTRRRRPSPDTSRGMYGALRTDTCIPRRGAQRCPLGTAVVLEEGTRTTPNQTRPQERPLTCRGRYPVSLAWSSSAFSLS